MLADKKNTFNIIQMYVHDDFVCKHNKKGHDTNLQTCIYIYMKYDLLHTMNIRAGMLSYDNSAALNTHTSGHQYLCTVINCYLTHIVIM